MTTTLLDAQPQGTTIRALTQRVQAEYAEMPGLSLTMSQAQRLWGLDRWTCALVLKTLTAKRVLARTAEGRYVRA